VLERIERTLLLATHDLPLAAELCERAVVLAGGRIVADGPTPEVVVEVTTPTASEPAKVTFEESPAPEIAVAANAPFGASASTVTPPPPERSASPRRALVVIVARLTEIATPTPEPLDPTLLPSALDDERAFAPAWIC